MDDVQLKLLALMVPTLMIPILMLLLVRRMSRRKTSVPPSAWPECRCPNCGAPMQAGFALAPKGVHWRERRQSRGLRHMMVFGALPNTFNNGFAPRQNLAWCCDRCALLLMDHSRMVG